MVIPKHCPGHAPGSFADRLWAKGNQIAYDAEADRDQASDKSAGKCCCSHAHHLTQRRKKKPGVHPEVVTGYNPGMYETPPRRWLAFRLRTLFAVAIPVCAALAWSAHSLNWIKQRRAILERDNIWEVSDQGTSLPSAPGGLWIFGERGIQELWMHGYDHETIQVARTAFPEADVIGGVRSATAFEPVDIPKGYVLPYRTIP
jgi:hypothetical protein